jgi:hypothetical protein
MHHNVLYDAFARDGGGGSQSGIFAIEPEHWKTGTMDPTREKQRITIPESILPAVILHLVRGRSEIGEKLARRASPKK